MINQGFLPGIAFPGKLAIWIRLLRQGPAS